PPRVLVGDLDDVGLLALVLRVELGAAGVVDVPAICMQRHRNVLPDIPDAVNVLRVTARNITGGHHLLTATLQIGVAALAAIVEPVVIDLLLLAFHADHYGPGLVVVRGRAPVGQP